MIGLSGSPHQGKKDIFPATWKTGRCATAHLRNWPVKFFDLGGEEDFMSQEMRKNICGAAAPIAVFVEASACGISRVVLELISKAKGDSFKISS